MDSPVVSNPAPGRRNALRPVRRPSRVATIPLPGGPPPLRPPRRRAPGLRWYREGLGIPSMKLPILTLTILSLVVTPSVGCGGSGGATTATGPESQRVTDVLAGYYAARADGDA